MHLGSQDHPENHRNTKRARAEAAPADAPLARPPDVIHPGRMFVMPQR